MVLHPKVAVVSANFGDFDKVPEDGRITITEKDFPLRDKSMSPRLQARIVKTHMWQFVPGFEYYLWVDCSMKLKPTAVKWFIEQLGDHDIAAFKHPHRKTVQDEANYLKERLAKNCPYITPRYEHEDIDGQLTVVNPEDTLYATTALIYKDSPNVRHCMKQWFYQCARYHSIDQLSFYHTMGWCDLMTIPDNYLKIPDVMEYVR